MQESGLCVDESETDVRIEQAKKQMLENLKFNSKLKKILERRDCFTME